MEDQEHQPDPNTLIELRHQHKAMEREMQVSEQVKPSTLEELNLAHGDNEHKTVLIAKDMQSIDKDELVKLL